MIPCTSIQSTFKSKSRNDPRNITFTINGYVQSMLCECRAQKVHAAIWLQKVVPVMTSGMAAVQEHVTCLGDRIDLGKAEGWVLADVPQ